MHAPTSPPTDTPTEQASLENLATALAERGYHAALRTPSTRPPFLNVLNPRARVLTERVHIQADAFWFSWGERIAGCDQVSPAADILARVLRAVDGQ